MKNATPFQFTNNIPNVATAADLAGHLAEIFGRQRFVPCGASQKLSSGFVDPMSDIDSDPIVDDGADLEDPQEHGKPSVEQKISTLKYVRQCDSALVFALRTETKSVPGAMINQELKLRCAKLEKEQGFRPGRKQTKELKEQIADELLPKSFPKRRQTTGYIDLKNGLLVIGSASSSVVGDFVHALLKAVEGLSLNSFHTKHTPRQALTAWLLDGEAPDDSAFTIDMDGEIKHSSGGVIRFKNQNMTVEEVRNHLKQGYEVSKLGLTWNDRVSFVATQSFNLTKMDWIESGKQVEDGLKEMDREMAFAAGMIVTIADIAGTVDAMARAYGGVLAQSEEAEQREAA